MCTACQAAARTEAGHLAGILRACDHDPEDRRMLLCAHHLSDLIALAGQRTLALVAWQAGCLAAALPPPAPTPDWESGRLTIWPWSRRRPARLDACSLCVAHDAVERQATEDVRTSLRAARPVPGHQVPLCVRHLLSLKAADPRAGQLAAPAAAELAETLITELDEAFSKSTWARRHEAGGLEMTAWRRAAAFLDGSVLLGCP
jgi:hypothetical protein